MKKSKIIVLMTLFLLIASMYNSIVPTLTHAQRTDNGPIVVYVDPDYVSQPIGSSFIIAVKVDNVVEAQSSSSTPPNPHP